MVSAWFDSAAQAMDARNVLFHATHYGLANQTKWVPQTEHIRTRAARDVQS